MSVTTQNSTEYANLVASPPRRNRPDQQHGRVRIAYFTFTQSGAGDANSLVNLCKIPAGRGRILKKNSTVTFSAFGSARVLDVGHTGWTKADGTSQTASANVLQDAEDVSAQGNTMLGEGTAAVTSPILAFDSKTDIVIQAKCRVDTLPDGATLEGYITYVID